jgi:hypothetical protein
MSAKDVIINVSMIIGRDILFLFNPAVSSAIISLLILRLLIAKIDE